MITTSSTQLEGGIRDMNFKGYSASLGGVYKLHNGEKVYQLAIKNTAFEEVFESNYIYIDEKDALKDAKIIIRKAKGMQKKGYNEEQSFNSVEKEKEIRVIKTKWQKIEHFTNILNWITISALLFMSISQIFALSAIHNEALFIIMVLFISLGLITVVASVLSLTIVEKDRKLTKKQRIIWKVILLINYINDNPFVLWNKQPLTGEKGWYSATPLIFLLFEGFFSVFILLMLDGYLIISTIIVLSLFIVYYISSFVWEVADAKNKEADYSNLFQRIIVPPLTIAVLILFCYVFIRYFLMNR